LVAATETLTPNSERLCALPPLSQGQAFGQTLDLWRVQCVQLGMVGLLLSEQPRDPRQRLGKVRRQFRTAGELAAHVARDTAEKGLQAPISRRARRICRACA